MISFSPVRIVASILICLFFSELAFAQANSATIFGKLVDQDEAPVVYSTVALYTLDSVLVKGEVSDLEGNFSIRNITAGQYFVMVQNVEFNPFYSATISLLADQSYDMNTVKLEPRNVELEGVMVTAKRQMVEVLPDKMVFNVASTINASGNNGLELLRKAPGVMIDPDNNVILQGKSGVRIFINGRPSRLSGSDLTTFLESMQSDNIEKIELITNPSAKYEAEGNAGIINIELKNNVNLGYNGNVVHSYSKGTEPRMNTGVSFNYGKNKLGITANITRFDNRYYEGFDDDKTQSGYLLSLYSDEREDVSGFNASTSITYTFNDAHSVNFSGGGVLTDAAIRLNSNTRIEDLSDPTANQLLLSETNSDFKARNFNYNLNYRWKTSDKSSLNADVSYGSFLKDNFIDQPNTYFEEDGVTQIREVNNAFEPYTEIDLYSAKVDYEYQMSKVIWSTGAKYYEVQTKNSFVVSDVVNEVSTVNQDKSNTFNYTEKVGAAYLIGAFELSDNLKANAGVRVEQTYSQGILESNQVNADDNVKRDYLNVFPNMSLSYSFGKSEMSLGYGKRITRPSYQDLNPFESKTSELTTWKGNPFLNPNYITNYQLTYSFNNALVISNTFSITEGFFARLLEIVDETGTFIVPRNMRRSTTNGLSISYPHEVTKWWETAVFLNYNITTYTGEFDNTNIDISANIYNLRSQNTFQLPWDVLLNVAAYYNSPFIWRGSIEIDGFYGIEFGIRKNFFDEKLQVRLTGSDIFNTASDYAYFGDYGGLEIVGTYLSDNHRFGFGLTYKFGNQKIKRQRRSGALDDELNRISD
ncbi:MAG: TonB-dependent receptor [Cyclobacteriaceae bacterium]